MSGLCRVSLCCVGAAILLTGCGGSGIKDKVYRVSGTVKYSDGQPVPSGTIYFDSLKYSAFGAIQSDGSFKLTTVNPDDGAPAGEYTAYFGGDLMGGGTGKPALIDLKYGGAGTSGLKYEVKPQSNTFDIQVERYTPPPPMKM